MIWLESVQAVRQARKAGKAEIGRIEMGKKDCYVVAASLYMHLLTSKHTAPLLQSAVCGFVVPASLHLIALWKQGLGSDAGGSDWSGKEQWRMSLSTRESYFKESLHVTIESN